MIRQFELNVSDKACGKEALEKCTSQEKQIQTCIPDLSESPDRRHMCKHTGNESAQDCQENEMCNPFRVKVNFGPEAMLPGGSICSCWKSIPYALICSLQHGL